MSNPIPPEAPRRFSWVRLTALSIAFLCIVAAVIISIPPGVTTQPTSVVPAQLALPLPAATPAPEPPLSIRTPRPTPSATKVIPAASQPRRLQVPSAAIDITVASLPEDSVDGSVITPPEDPTLVYWVSQFGFSLAGEGSTDTVVIAAHSGVDSKWLFNRLSDSALVKVGDLIIITTDIGILNYKVTVTDHVARNDVANAYLNSHRPDELLLVSCFTADLHAQNRLVVATLVRDQ
jgi:LPXTG-site transpeptidase (sortase) family protein